MPRRPRHLGRGFVGLRLHWRLIQRCQRQFTVRGCRIRVFRHRGRLLRRLPSRVLGLSRRLDRQRHFLRRKRRQSIRLPIGVFLRSPLDRLRFRQLPRLTDLPVKTSRLGNHKLRLFHHHRGKLHHVLDRRTFIQLLGHPHQSIHRHHRWPRLVHSQLRLVLRRLIFRLLQLPSHPFRGHLSLFKETRRQSRRLQRREIGLWILRLRRLLPHPLRHFRFVLSRTLQLIQSRPQSIPRNRIQFFPHLRIRRQLRLQFLEQILGILLLHLLQHRGLRKLLINLSLDSLFLLHRSQRHPRLLRRFPRFQRRVVLPNQIQGIDNLSLLLHRSLQLGLLSQNLLRHRRVEQRLLRPRWWIFQQGQRIIGIPHSLPLILLQNVLLIGIRTNQILQGINPQI